MIHVKTLNDNDAQTAMSRGEFPEAVRTSRQFVAVILTQSWCPDWIWMKGWIGRQKANNQPEDLDLDVYEIEYNKVPYFDDFRTFKERTFGNSLIPYVRYYVGGKLVGDSNQVTAEEFYARFRKKTK